MKNSNPKNQSLETSILKTSSMNPVTVNPSGPPGPTRNPPHGETPSHRKDLHPTRDTCSDREYPLPTIRPILLYDNDCGICTRFAHIAQRTSRGWVDPVGLFTERGATIKSGFFSPNDQPDQMFWLLIGDTGYGGRSGLLPLAREIVRGRVL